MKKIPPPPNSQGKHKRYLGVNNYTNNNNKVPLSSSSVASSPYLQSVAPKPAKKLTRQEETFLYQKREDRFTNEIDPSVFVENNSSNNNTSENENNLIHQNNTRDRILTTTSSVMVKNRTNVAVDDEPSNKDNFMFDFQEQIFKKLFPVSAGIVGAPGSSVDDNYAAALPCYFLSQSECGLVMDILRRMPPSSSMQSNQRSTAQKTEKALVDCCQKLFELILKMVTWCVSYDCAHEEEVSGGVEEEDDDGNEMNTHNNHANNKLHLAVPILLPTTTNSAEGNTKAKHHKNNTNNDNLINGLFFISQCCAEMNYTRTPPLTSSMFKTLTKSFPTLDVTRGVIGEFVLFLCWLSQRYDFPRLACVCEILRNQYLSSSSSSVIMIKSTVFAPISSMFDLLFYGEVLTMKENKHHDKQFEEDEGESDDDSDDDEKNALRKNGSILFSSSEKNFEKRLLQMIRNDVETSAAEEKDLISRRLRFALENLRISYLKFKLIKNHIKPYSTNDFISAATAAVEMTPRAPSASSSSSSSQKSHHHKKYLQGIANFQKDVQSGIFTIKELAEVASVASLASSRVVDSEFVGRILNQYLEEDFNVDDDDDEEEDDNEDAGHPVTEAVVKARVVKDEKDIQSEHDEKRKKLEQLRRRNDIVLGLADQIINVAEETHTNVFGAWQNAAQLGLDQKYLRGGNEIPRRNKSNNNNHRNNIVISSSSASSSSSSSLRTKILQDTTTELSGGNLSDFIRTSLTKAAHIEIEIDRNKNNNTSNDDDRKSYSNPGEIFSKNILKSVLADKERQGLLSVKAATSSLAMKNKKIGDIVMMKSNRGKNISTSHHDQQDGNDEQQKSSSSSIFEGNLRSLLKNLKNIVDVVNVNGDEDCDECEETDDETKKTKSRTNIIPIKMMSETPFDASYRKTLRSKMVGEE